MFVTNHPTIVKCAKKCYDEYPTVVNKLKESGIVYNNTKEEYAKMDAKLSKSQRAIGESSNLAQLAMTYYWTELAKPEEEQNKEYIKDLYDNFVILAVLAQVAIDSTKREYEITAQDEINRIKKMPCMNRTVLNEETGKMEKCDLPKFMKYTKQVSTTKNGKQKDKELLKYERGKVSSRISDDFICPMNWTVECLNKIQNISYSANIPTVDFFIKPKKYANNRQMSKVRQIVEEYAHFVLDNLHILTGETEYEDMFYVTDKTHEVIEQLSKIKLGQATVCRLVETAMGIDEAHGPKYKNAVKYTRKMMDLLFKSNREKFLNCFKTYDEYTKSA